MKKKLQNVLAGLFCLLALPALALADSSDGFDPTQFESTMESGVSAATSVAISIAGLSAGVIAWKKVRKYFGSAG